MDEAVIVVSREPERVAKPEPEGYFRERVVSSESQKQRVEEDQPIGENGQGEPTAGCDQDRKGDEDRRFFQNSSEPIPWRSSGQSHRDQQKAEQDRAFATALRPPATVRRNRGRRRGPSSRAAGNR
jgi:hypothetical protein